MVRYRQAYAHKMALEGGRLVASILGTTTMEMQDDEGTELVACMARFYLLLRFSLTRRADERAATHT
jgi:hypothetical protein